MRCSVSAGRRRGSGCGRNRRRVWSESFAPSSRRRATVRRGCRLRSSGGPPTTPTQRRARRPANETIWPTGRGSRPTGSRGSIRRSPSARAFREPLALGLLDVAAGEERAVAASLGHRASAVVARDVARALELVERARTAGLGSVVVLVGRDPRDLVLPVVSRDELLASPVAAVTADGVGWDPARGELWFAGET